MTTLIEAIKRHGIIRAPEGTDFTLASGAKSKFYIDFSKIVMTRDGMEAVVSAILLKLIDLEFDRIGGPMSGADPIVGAAILSLTGVRGFTVRKEPKGRGPGAGEMYEGYLDAGDRVVLVEDVTTSGNSVMNAIRVVEARGAKIVRVITLLDRLAGAAELLKDYDFVALTKLTDLGL